LISFIVKFGTNIDLQARS